jgi:hypothetical protein
MGASMSIKPEMAAEVPAVVPRYQVTLYEEDVSPAEMAECRRLDEEKVTREMMAERRRLADMSATGFVEKLFYRTKLLFDWSIKLEKVRTLDGVLHEKRNIREMHDNFRSDFESSLDEISGCSKDMKDRVGFAIDGYIRAFGMVMHECDRAEIAFKYGFTPVWEFLRT